MNTDNLKQIWLNEQEAAHIHGNRKLLIYTVGIFLISMADMRRIMICHGIISRLYYRI